MSVEDKVRSVKVNDAVIVDGCMVRVLAVTPDGRAVVSKSQSSAFDGCRVTIEPLDDEWPVVGEFRLDWFGVWCFYPSNFPRFRPCIRKVVRS